jgi:thiamine-phosphate pyrophosphorylase
LPRIINPRIERIIDANINRAKEGLRVCEEICRFTLEHQEITRRLKRLRHKLADLSAGLSCREELLAARQSKADIGRRIHTGELKRRGIKDIFFANIQRVKESLRVLEEFSKLKNVKSALGFKKVRYDVYECEKKITAKIAPLSGSR